MADQISVARADLAILGPGSTLARIHLHDALRNNHVLLVRQLLEIGVDPNANFEGPIIDAPLFHARSDEMVSVLVAGGALVDARNPSGYTPLSFAAICCSTEPGPKTHGVLAALVRAAADVNARTLHGHTPLEIPGPAHPCIALAGKPAPSVRPATRSEFWRRRALLALLRAGALVSNIERPELRESLKRFADFDQYCADHRRVWVSVITKCAAVPRDAASVAAATFIPRDAAGVVAAFVSPRGGY
mmetsp:Transcript_1969/g.6503  ORF Transcript_1969/g.6503 Transcript_1969/m.6503 type:complete len:246 (+) Transcript_1969:32-769(+)